MNNCLLILVTSMLLGCQTKNTENEKSKSNVNTDSLTTKSKKADSDYEDSGKIKNSASNNGPKTADLTVISEDCVVFILPDSTQIAAMKGKTEEEEENFYVAADDNNFYQYEASRFLDSLQVKKIYPKTRYLKFIMKND